MTVHFATKVAGVRSEPRKAVAVTTINAVTMVRLRRRSIRPKSLGSTVSTSTNVRNCQLCFTYEVLIRETCCPRMIGPGAASRRAVRGREGGRATGADLFPGLLLRERFCHLELFGLVDHHPDGAITQPVAVRARKSEPLADLRDREVFEVPEHQHRAFPLVERGQAAEQFHPEIQRVQEAPAERVGIDVGG